VRRRRYQGFERCDLLVICVGVATGAVTTAFGALALEPWEQVLSQQLGSEQKCILTSTYDVQRWRLGDEMVLSGKARCYDGREFDFSQKKSHLKFDLRFCEPTVC
jgi:hypothetical protein